MEAQNDERKAISELKDCLDILEKLKGIRKDLKRKLNKEDLSDADEAEFAGNLHQVSKQIEHLEKKKFTILKMKTK